MGEYYYWVNADKREYFFPGDFDYDVHRTTSSQRGNTVLNALKELLATDWKGESVVFLGDEASIPANSGNAILEKMYEQSVQFGHPGNGYDTFMETYINISGWFSASEPDVREHIENYIADINDGYFDYVNEYGIDILDPYKGLFQRSGRDYNYTINHTKKVYYTFPYTRIFNKSNYELEWADPLPILMHFGRHDSRGLWLGDIIDASDVKPEGYELLKEIRIDL